ncbi:MAG: hypothetical protein IJT18_05495 [Oscillospiraceae bacterium]|nr:hypothetical protein [Oscillospiraceae bacterium]
MQNSKRKIISLFLELTLLSGLSTGASAIRLRSLRGALGTIRCMIDPRSCTKQTASPKTETAPMPAPQTNTQTENTASVLAYEKQVVELINQQRSKNGLQPLTLSSDLCAKARIKSQDMASNGYFSHTSPIYGSPFDMMKSLGISYRAAGENIAMGYSTPDAVVTAWMNSSGHRANILSASYTTIGVGYVANGNYWTQWFIG